MLKKLVPLSLAAVVFVGAPFHTSAKEMSATDILKQSKEAMTEVESYSTKTNMEQSIPLDGKTMSTSSESEADITLKPFAMHQVVTTKSAEEGEMSLESYWTEKGFYQEDPEKGWVKMPEELTQGLKKLQSSSMVEGQMAQAEKLGKEMSVEETDEGFVLTYEGDGKTLMEASMKMFEESMSGEGSESMKGLMEQMTINDFNYEVTVDKETYYMKHLTMDIDMDIEVKGKSTNITQSMDMSMDHYNEVDQITVPANVIDSAKPLKGEGGQLPKTATSNPMLALGGATLAVVAGGLLLYRRRAHSY
ncbi:MAG: LPXTG cell wall anchor domain-containing protein [Anaerobacillus sp.]